MAVKFLLRTDRAPRVLWSMRSKTFGVLLAIAAASSFAWGCSGTGEEVPDDVGSQTYAVIGNAVLGKGVVMLSNISDHKQFCTAVVINHHAMLTAARCLQRFLPSKTSLEPSPNTFEGRINAEMVRIAEGVATKVCVNGFKDADGNCTSKPKQLLLFRENPLSSTDTDDDLALLYSDGYGWKGLGADNEDYADIYMGDMPGGSNLEITGHGWNDKENGRATFYPYRASLPLMQVTSGSALLLASTNARPCDGDQGAPYTVPGTGEIFGLHSYNEAVTSNGCASPGYVRGTRLRDKVGWIESIVGKCATSLNANGQPVKKCYVTGDANQECNGASHVTADTARWSGCRGTGCGVCSELVTFNTYPRYFTNHPSCASNPTCDGFYGTCSVNCPKPTVVDQAAWGVGLKGSYNGVPTTDFGASWYGRYDKTIDFNWGNGTPIDGFKPDNFSIQWKGLLKVPSNGSYTFQTYTDDGVRLRVNGVTLIDKYVAQAPTTWTSNAVTLTAGIAKIEVDYMEKTGGAVAQLRWKPPGAASFVTIPASNLSPP